MEEILSSADLYSEGQAMANCVAEYAEECLKDECRILSLRFQGRRKLTLEVAANLRLEQALGYENREATPRERKVIAKWLYSVLIESPGA